MSDFDKLFNDEKSDEPTKVTKTNGHDSDKESDAAKSDAEEKAADSDVEEDTKAKADASDDEAEKADSDDEAGKADSDDEVGKGDSDDEDRKKEVVLSDDDDDTKDVKPQDEEKEAETGISDEEYFKSLDSEELDWYKEHAPDHNKNVQCNSCFKAITPFINTASGVFRHPLLAVCMCKGCKNYYGDGEWERDEEGCDKFCRWCGQGGDILICDKCPHAFCRKCLQRNLGRKVFSEITKAEEWKCLVCDPKQIYAQKAFYYALYTHQDDFAAKKAKNDESSRRSSLKGRGSIKKLTKELTSTASTNKTFIDDTLLEAFKTLGVYQRALEEERKRWMKANRELDPELALTITQKLKRIFAKSRTNMLLLDEAVSTGFKEKFPELGKKIRVAKASEGSSSSSVKKTPKKSATANSDGTPKRKILPKKKPTSTPVTPDKAGDSKPGPKSSKPGPKSVKLAGPKSAKPGPKSAKQNSSDDEEETSGKKKTPAKVSMKLFANIKKRPKSAEIVKDDDSSSGSELDFPASKKARSSSPSPAKKSPSPAKKKARSPSPASSDAETPAKPVAEVKPSTTKTETEEPPKKKRPGPKSKTQ